MKKVIALIIFVILIASSAYYAFVYYSHFSVGFRAGELIKISHKGVIFKTWEGEISQGVSESQRFVFSVEEKEVQVIKQLKNLQGKQVNLTYIERYNTFPWLGDTKYFITEVELVNEKTPKKPNTIKEHYNEEKIKSTKISTDTIEI